MNTYWANISSDVVYESGKAADDYCNHAMAIYRHIKTVTQSCLSDAIFFFSGPPSNFVLDSKMQGSLSFSWGTPPAPSIPTGYLVECLAMVTGARNPPPVETRERNATLSPLSPGVLYLCTLSTLTASKMLPSVTITATTLESGNRY